MVNAGNAAADLKPWVRARVIDIREVDTLIAKRYLVDTNVLYFMHYDRVHNLDELKEGPRPYQLEQYPRYLRRIRGSGGSLFCHRLALIEFARTVEIAELKILYAVKTPSVTVVPADLRIKSLRIKFPSDYKACQQRVITYLRAVRKAYTLVSMTTCEEVVFWTQWDACWQTTLADPADSAQAVEALRNGISGIISDDVDWATIDGISLFTANKVAIDAARLAGRLARDPHPHSD